MEKIKVRLGKNSYPIFIEPGALKNFPRFLTNFFHSRPVALISDSNVSQLYGNDVVNSLLKSGINAQLFTFPQGESSKNIKQAYKLYSGLIENRMGRDTVITALGGGVTGDLAGFVAATYLRGVRFVQIPTTLLAQVDSSIGGKVGINHELGKNLVGSFYQPCFVLVDPDFLQTLPQREIISGMGEVIKYSLIGNKQLFNSIEDKIWPNLSKNNLYEIPFVIKACCRIKSKIVSGDEKESGLRKILNFGHTLGHAIEQVTDYSVFTHGEAVILGMRWAAWFSMNKGLLKEAAFLRIENFLMHVKVPDIPSKVNSKKITGAISVDKKTTAKNLTLILLRDIGRPVFEKVENIPDLLKPIDRWLNYVYKK